MAARLDMRMTKHPQVMTKHPQWPARILIQVESRAFGRAVLSGIAAHPASAAWQWIWSDHPWPSKEESQLRTLHAAGAIVQIKDAHVADALKAAPFPVVNVSRDPAGKDFPTICSDERRSGQVSARHLLDAGVRRVAFIGDDAIASWRLRREAAADMIRAAHAEAIIPLIACTGVFQDWVAPVHGWLLSQGMPQRGRLGVMVANDRIAMDVIQAVALAHLAIPRDVIVLGHGNEDDITIRATMGRRLSSLQPDAQQIGWKAAALLDRLMHGGVARTGAIQVPPLGVIARSSTQSALQGNAANAEEARALRWIHQHARSGATARQAADALGWSVDRLERVCKRCAASSPGALLRRLRVEAARNAMAAGEHDVAAIAQRHGFSSKRHLRDAVRAHARTLVRKSDPGSHPTPM